MASNGSRTKALPVVISTLALLITAVSVTFAMSQGGATAWQKLITDRHELAIKSVSDKEAALELRVEKNEGVNLLILSKLEDINKLMEKQDTGMARVEKLLLNHMLGK